MFSGKYLFKRIVLGLVFLSLLLSSSYSLYAGLCYTEDEIEYSNMRELSYSEKLKSNVFITKKEDQYFINKNDEYLLIEGGIPFSPLLGNNEADLTYVLKKANTHFEIIKNDEIIKEYFIDGKKDIYNPVTSKDGEHFSYIYVSSETVDGRKYKVNIDGVDSQEYGIITNFVFSDDGSSYGFIAYDDSGLSRILIKDGDKINAPMFQEYKGISYEGSSNDLIKILSFIDGYIVEKTNGALIKFPNIDTMGVSYSLPLVYIDEINQLMMISSRGGNNYGLSFITNSDDCSDLKSKHVQHEKEYIISTPTIKNGVTIISENSFYGEVVDENVYSVKVNGYKLNTFNGDTWRYHAYARFGTLVEGRNEYLVEYFSQGDDLIHSEKIVVNFTSIEPYSVLETVGVYEKLLLNTKYAKYKDSLKNRIQNFSVSKSKDIIEKIIPLEASEGLNKDRFVLLRYIKLLLLENIDKNN